RARQALRLAVLLRPQDREPGIHGVSQDEREIPRFLQRPGALQAAALADAAAWRAARDVLLPGRKIPRAEGATHRRTAWLSAGRQSRPRLRGRCARLPESESAPGALRRQLRTRADTDLRHR